MHRAFLGWMAEEGGEGVESITKAARVLLSHQEPCISCSLLFYPLQLLLICLLPSDLCTKETNTIDLNKNAPKRLFIKTASVKCDV